jgi:hypothetical protein
MDLSKTQAEMKNLDKDSEQSSRHISSLWQNKEFTGAFAGVIFFKHSLYYELGITVSESKLRKILAHVPAFSLFMRLSKRHKVRHYTIHGSFQEKTYKKHKN